MPYLTFKYRQFNLTRQQFTFEHFMMALAYLNDMSRLAFQIAFSKNFDIFFLYTSHV